MKLTVLGMGARGPSGLTALQVAMSARARQLEPSGSPFRDQRGRSVGVARCIAVPEALRGVERLVSLAAPAAREALPRAAPRTPIPLVLALSDSERPDAISGSDERILAGIAAACDGRIDLRRSRAVRAGHAGFVAALEEGRRALYEGAREVLVGGADTHYDADVVAWLEAKGRLCTEDDANGRIPSEGAAFVRLGFRPAPRNYVTRPAMTGVEFERAALHSTASATVEKLVRRVYASTRAPRPGVVITDLNGERARAEEWLDAERHLSDLLDDVPHLELVQHLGDLGAATGGMLATIACTLARSGALPATSCVVALHADGPERAVFALDLPDPGGDFQASTELPVARAVPRRRRACTPEERDHLRRIARSCLEDLGSLGLLLAPGPVTADRDPARLSERLLANLDALAALVAFDPEIVDYVRGYGEEIAPPDRARRFAAAFALRHLARASGSAHAPR